MKGLRTMYCLQQAGKSPLEKSNESHPQFYKHTTLCDTMSTQKRSLLKREQMNTNLLSNSLLHTKKMEGRGMIKYSIKTSS